MATSPSRVAWDACAWIALMQRERILADGVERYTRCRAVIDQAAAGKIEIVCSALCLAEVCKNPAVRIEEEDQVSAFFEHDYLVTSEVVPVGRTGFPLG